MFVFDKSVEFRRRFMRFEIFAAALIICYATACNNKNPVSDVNNLPPVIQAIIFRPDTIIAGQSCIVKCIAVDPNNDKLSYFWNTIGNIAMEGGDGSSVYYTPNSCCSEPKIQLTVKDGRNGEADTLFDVPFKYEE